MNICCAKNNTSFKSRPVCSLNLVKLSRSGETTPIKAFFSELSTNCEEDVKAIKEIDKNWENAFVKDNFITMFMDTSNAEVKFFCLEQQGNTKLSERILGLVATEKEAGGYELLLIQTNPEFQSNFSKFRPIKNIGENIFACVVNEAKKAQASCVRFYSVCDGFYKKITKNADVSLKEKKYEYQILQGDYDKFLNYYERTYGTDFSDKFDIGKKN